VRRAFFLVPVRDLLRVLGRSRRSGASLKRLPSPVLTVAGVPEDALSTARRRAGVAVRVLWPAAALGAPVVMGADRLGAAWSRPLAAALVCAGLAALSCRLLIHRRLGYGRSARHAYRAHCRYFAAMVLAEIPAAALSGGTGLAASWLLVILALLYGISSDRLNAYRKANNVPTATDWLLTRTTSDGLSVGEVVDAGQSAPTRMLGKLTRRPAGEQRRVVPRGATIAGGAVIGAILTASLGQAVAGTVQARRQPPSPVTAGAAATPSAAPPSAAPELPVPTYDEVCGRDALQPGDGAPAWASAALRELWLGRGRGVGALLAGCVRPAESPPGQPDVVFQVGVLAGELVGVGVCVRLGPTTLYLGPATAAVLAKLRRGVVVTGPDGGVVSAIAATRPGRNGAVSVTAAVAGH
jgi:hypothetical protein